jgi:hypothetical protein
MRDDQLNGAALKDHHQSVSIATYTGLEVFPFDPRKEQICLEDIGHALAMKCRFTGHTRVHYSVAQHSVLTAQLAQIRKFPLEVQKQALLHDASEAYFPDVASPLKKSLWVADPIDVEWDKYDGHNWSPYKEAENSLQRCIYSAFGVDLVEHPAVKAFDADVYHREKWSLMPEVKNFETPKPACDVPLVYPCSPAAAKYDFMALAKSLGLK